MRDINELIYKLEKDDRVTIFCCFAVGILTPLLSIALLLGYYFFYQVVQEKQKNLINQMSTLWLFVFTVLSLISVFISFETNIAIMSDGLSLTRLGFITSLSYVMSIIFYAQLATVGLNFLFLLSGKSILLPIPKFLTIDFISIIDRYQNKKTI